MERNTSVPTFSASSSPRSTSGGRTRRGTRFRSWPVHRFSQFAPAAVLMYFCLAAASAQSPPAVVRRIQAVPDRNGGFTVQIVSSTLFAPEISCLENPKRIVIDLPNALLSGQKRILVNSRGVRDVRAAQFKISPPVARVVVQLSEVQDYSIATSADRVTLSLRPVEPGSGKSTAPHLAVVAAAPIASAPLATNIPQPVRAQTVELPTHVVNGPSTITAGAEMPIVNLLRGGDIQVLRLSVAPLQNGSKLIPGNSTRAAGITLLDALRSTLQNQPLIGVQQAQITINRGIKLQASAPFDTLVRSSITQNHVNTPLSSFAASQIGLPPDSFNQVSDLTNYTFSLGKQFRNGITVAPTYGISRDVDNTINPALNNSMLSFVVTVPLLRGRGHNATAPATEDAAVAEVDASLLDLNQLIAELLANTATSYWNFVAAKKLLAIASDAEQRGGVYVDNVRALIEADHVPHSDLNEVAANLADRAANRIASQQQLVAARQQLSLDMGTSARQMITVADAVDDFPVAEDQVLPVDTPNSLQYYLEQALRHRADFLAAHRRMDKAEILRAAANNSLLRQVNLNFGSGYSSLQEGRALSHFFGSSVLGLQGPNATFGVTYSFPAGNSSARGQMLQADATQQQSALQALQVERNISASLVTAVEGVRNAIMRAKKARESVESFQSALDGERERYRVGIGSVVDVLTVEDRLTNALINQVQAQLSYAAALVQFRLATGTIVAPDQSVQTVEPQTLVTLPFDSAPAVNR
jgi:outer membrane protein